MVDRAAPTSELGSLMLTPWSAFGVSADDISPLVWPNGLAVYHRMRNDSQIDGLTKAVTLPLLRMRWFIEPNGAPEQVVTTVASDLGLPIADQPNTPTRARRRFSHHTHLRHAILALWYGHMFMEQVGDIDPDLLWRLRKLAPRMPQTISRIHVATDGGLEGITQTGWRPPTGGRMANPFVQAPQIPVDRLVAYVWEREGANWTGRSMLRPLYRDWVLKDRALRVDAIKNERFGAGIPTGTAPAGGDPVEYQRMAAAIRASENGGVGLPAGASIGVDGIRGALPNVLASIRYYDESMARNFLAMLLQLGQTQTGSRALGETFDDFFRMAIEGVADWYATTTNEFVIEDMVDWNWGVDTPAPLLAWEYKDKNVLPAADLAALITGGVITVDPPLQAWARDAYDLPEPQDDPATSPLGGGGGGSTSVVVPDTAPANAPAAPTPPAPTPPVPGDVPTAPTTVTATGGDQPTKQTLAAKQTLGASATSASGVGHRAPSSVEAAASVDFAQLQQAWETGTSSIVDDWKTIQAAQIDALVQAVQAAVASGDVIGISSVSAPVLGDDVLHTYMTTMFEDAAAQARAEAVAQGVDIPVINVAEHDAMLRARAQAVSALMARGISESAARQALLRYGVDALTPEEVAAGVRAHLEELSDQYLNDQLGGALTQAQNAGRRAVMSQRPARIYASELLDLNTCDRCRPVDGRQYGSVTSAEQDYPTGGFKECLGGPRCRGTLVAVYDEAAPSVSGG